MLTMNWPWWIFVLIAGVAFWPVALAIGIGLLILAKLAHGWIRWTALVAALPCLTSPAVAAWWAFQARERDQEAAAFEARTHQTLNRPAIISGLPLPAGTDVQWQDVGHRQLAMASPPHPISLFGLEIDWIRYADAEQGWDLHLTGPQAIEGWTCAAIGVRVSRAGRLRSCQLAAGRFWHGWQIPADTHLDLAYPAKVEVTLPTGASMAAPEIGHDLTANGSFTLNSDGSLDRLYLEPDKPFIVAGQRLWNTVQWSYAPATEGQGRHRRAISVSGTVTSSEADAGGNVVVRFADNKISAAP